MITQQGLAIEQAVAAYKEIYLAGRDFAPRTRREYLTDLRQLDDYLLTAGVKTIEEVKRIHLERFVASLDHQALTPSTRRRKVAAVRSFFQFLKQAGYRIGNPAAELVPPELDWSQPRYLTEREYKRLLHEARGEPRDNAIIQLILQTGLRLSEVAPTPAHGRRATRASLFRGRPHWQRPHLGDRQAVSDDHAELEGLRSTPGLPCRSTA
jgi:integrase/recombinase XerD